MKMKLIFTLHNHYKPKPKFINLMMPIHQKKKIKKEKKKKKKNNSKINSVTQLIDEVFLKEKLFLFNKLINLEK